jgi:hypothetical protein
MAQPTEKPRKPIIAAAITVLVLVAITGTLVVPIYASATPKVGAFPFFYAWLILWMPAVAILLWIAFLLGKRLRPHDSGEESE